MTVHLLITIAAICACCLFVSHATAESQSHAIRIDFAEESNPQHIFWNGTGFTPGQLLLRADMQQTLDYQAAIANQGMRYVRPHWLLNLVSVRNPGSAEAHYNFQRLFAALDQIVERDMKLVFEIMGFPHIDERDQLTYDANAQGQGGSENQWVPDFTRREDYMLWYDFVLQLVTALEDRYGEDELRSWYFESTNEPDIHEWFWKQGIPALLNYWDASSAAIKAVNPAYVFGGPGTATILSAEFKAVLAHCDTGINAITGERGSVLDFISIHAKNMPYAMIDMERRAIDYIQTHHPRFRDLPFWNNEADPTWGWRRPFWWRPRPWYGSFVVQSVDAHNRLLMDTTDITYGVLVNDNGFLGDWYTRTALARFANEADASQFWLIKKPVHNAMSLLALLTGQRFPVHGLPTVRNPTSIIPIRKANGDLVILVANLPDFGPVRSGAESDQVITSEQQERIDAQGAHLRLQLHHHGLGQPRISEVRIDDRRANPYQVWLDMGKPTKLDHAAYTRLAKHMEPAVVQRRQALEAGPISLAMEPGSLAMLVISDGAAEHAAEHDNPAVTAITRYQGAQGQRTEFVRWEYIPDALVTYTVYAAHDGGPYQQVNPAPLFDRGFLHIVPDHVEEVTYRITVEPL